MTSTQIRQSFLDFFKSKQHTIVPSSSLMPDSPNLLFTNAGMNQFVPIFLGQTQCPYHPGRAADTQKCIRAGGKHNDLDDVGLDTYHHTFFEMLGNWSFGDYFKQEAIAWAWELVVEIWKFPPQRIYATVYNPDKSKNDPSDFDQEAWNFWAGKFRSVGLDPAIHIVNGNKKDNFWMMGDTGPCGPCSELHVDLTPDGDTKGSLVNKGDARCIEIWNLVFIQFNAEPDGPEEAAKMALPNAKAGVDWRQRFVPLPAKHVDTGMGFERVTSIIQGTKGFKDFANAKISNYETDIFRPIFDVLEELSGKKYCSTLPGTAVVKSGKADPTAPCKTSGEAPGNIIEVPSVVRPEEPTCAEESGKFSAEQLQIDIAFRVIADHIRTLTFAIADGIQPGIKGRNGVLRSIHKRMVRYASTIDIKDDLLVKAQDALVDTLTATMGDVFPEIRSQKVHIKKVLRHEADVFNKTLGTGIERFNARLEFAKDIYGHVREVALLNQELTKNFQNGLPTKSDDGLVAIVKKQVSDWQLLPKNWDHLVATDEEMQFLSIRVKVLKAIEHLSASSGFDVNDLIRLLEMHKGIAWETIIPGKIAFLLYDTYGFPLDLTELMARERGLTVDRVGFDKLMDEQKKRSQEARVTQVIELSQIETTTPTKFVGYEHCDGAFANLLEVVDLKGRTAVILDSTPFYAEMGGQVGDTGMLGVGEALFEVASTTKSGNTILHIFKDSENGREIPRDEKVRAFVDYKRRFAIERHHTVTHLLHWALHEVASKEASQKGSFVGPDKLTFDFNSAPLTPQQVANIEKLVNERIVENAPVSWTEVKHKHVKDRPEVMQFFGDKYGEWVRVVQIGGKATALDGYSMELCGGTHTRATGEIGLFRIVGESAIAAGVRRIEAVAGLEAYGLANSQLQLIRSIAGKINSPVHELEKKVEMLLAHQKELEKSLRTEIQRNAAQTASKLLAQANEVNGVPLITHNFPDSDADYLQAIVDALKGRFKGVVTVGGAANGSVSLIASVSPEFTSKVQAGKIIQQIAPIVGGKGGGKPDNARGGGKDAGKLDEALAKVKSLLG